VTSMIGNSQGGAKIPLKQLKQLNNLGIDRTCPLSAWLGVRDDQRHAKRPLLKHRRLTFCRRRVDRLYSLPAGLKHSTTLQGAGVSSAQGCPVALKSDTKLDRYFVSVLSA